MKKLFVAAVAGLTVLAFAAVAAAALDPGVYDPGNTGCVKATVTKNKTLHLEKNCPTPTDAAAGAEITGVNGQTFQSAEFTLASATQCGGGSPRFVVVAGGVVYHLGCANVTPTTNANGTVTYHIDAGTLAAAKQPIPTGTISFVSILIDEQGVADITKISFNGIAQKVVTNKNKGLTAPCKNGGWKTFTTPKFKNQGQCVSSMVHSRNAAKKTARG